MAYVLETAGIRELSNEELLAVSGAKNSTPVTKKEICTTVLYDDGTTTRTCVPDKGK